jgi:hypothetical protein
MSGHKFALGEKVRYVPAFHQKAGAVTDFEVVRHLPDFNGEFFYRIKSSGEPHERVVGESQLSRYGGGEAPSIPPGQTSEAEPKTSRKTLRPRNKS